MTMPVTTSFSQALLRSRSARAWLLAAAIATICALTPGPARASGIPDPAQCTIPSHVALVGRDASGMADPLGTMTFVIKRLSGDPLNQGLIVLDFSNTPDMKPAAAQPDPAIFSVFCDGSNSSVRTMTGLDGRATIRIVGYAVPTAPAGAHAPTLNVYCNGVFLGTAIVSAFDLDGNSGINPTDNSVFLRDFFSGQYWERSDFDGNGVLGPSDLSLWVQAFFASNSVQSGGASCP
jgi:hypothetical protein